MLQRLSSFSSPSLSNAAGGLSVFLVAAGMATPALAATSASALEQQQDDLAAFQVIAHRGASGHAPESTLAAFTLAHEQGADYLEMDAQLTADGKLVVFHDDTIERTSDGTGHINDYTLAELKALDVGTWFNQANPEKADDAFEGARLLTLDEVFDTFGHDARYYIEAKSPALNPGLEDALLAKLKEYDMIQAGRVLVQSFNQPSLLKLHEQSPALPLVQLLWYYPDEKNATQLKEWTDVTPGSGNVDDADFQAIADYAVGIGTNFIYEGAPVISADFVDQAQDNDLRVHVYTVNDTDDMQQLLDWGVDGMFTNYPDQLLELTR
jgi:glycerophosphoryl diester phosphodiesterase